MRESEEVSSCRWTNICFSVFVFFFFFFSFYVIPDRVQVFFLVEENMFFFVSLPCFYFFSYYGGVILSILFLFPYPFDCYLSLTYFLSFLIFSSLFLFLLHYVGVSFSFNFRLYFLFCHLSYFSSISFLPLPVSSIFCLPSYGGVQRDIFTTDERSRFALVPFPTRFSFFPLVFSSLSSMSSDLLTPSFC